MSVLIAASSYRTLREGPAVFRATAVLPQTAQTPIFTVAGGLVLITKFIGVVTTVVQAQATTAQLIATPTTGTAVNLSNATADLNAAQVGATLTLPATLGGTALVSNAGAAAFLAAQLVVQTGTIDFKTVASSTGAMRFIITYVPLDDGASIVAA